MPQILRNSNDSNGNGAFKINLSGGGSLTKIRAVCPVKRNPQTKVQVAVINRFAPVADTRSGNYNDGLLKKAQQVIWFPFKLRGLVKFERERKNENKENFSGVVFDFWLKFINCGTDKIR